MPVTRTLVPALICAAAALSLAGCKSEPKADPAKVTEEVKATLAKTVAGFNAKNVGDAVSMDAADYVGMFHGMPNTVGKAADIQATQQQVGADAKLELSNETVDVAASGDLAVVRATYAFTMNDAKTRKPVTEHGNWVLGFKRQEDGSMKAVWSVASDTPAPAPKP